MGAPEPGPALGPSRKVRALAPIASTMIGASQSGVTIPMSGALNNPLIEVPVGARPRQLQTVSLVYLQREGDALLISRQKSASRDQCKQVVKLAHVRSVQRVSKSDFELSLSNSPPLRFCASDAWACNEWMSMLERLVGSTKDQAPSVTPVIPARSSSVISISPRAERDHGSRAETAAPLRLGGPLAALKRPPQKIDMAEAHPRGWHVNIRSGQSGLKQLRSVATSTPMPARSAVLGGEVYEG